MARRIIDFEIGGHALRLKVADSTFIPNLTSQLLAQTAAIPAGGRVLDLGCGVGPIAIFMALSGAGEVYAVDIMGEACELARENARLNAPGKPIHVLHGSLFEPVSHLTFDLVVDDVSGMGEEVSRLSPWYPPPIPTGGSDGTAPTIRMLEEAPARLNPGGSLYFPVISLASAAKILDRARGIYGAGLRKVAEKRIPFCDELKDHLGELEELRQRGLLDFERIRTRYFWMIEIYQAIRP